MGRKEGWASVFFVGGANELHGWIGMPGRKWALRTANRSYLFTPEPPHSPHTVAGPKMWTTKPLPPQPGHFGRELELELGL